MKTKVEIKLKTGKTLSCKKEDYYGFFTRPFSWDYTIKKFKRLAGNVINDKAKDDIINTIQHLDEEKDMEHMIKLLSV
jgi:2-methylcitrate dehydratase